jgi:hypothetical protein
MLIENIGIVVPARRQRRQRRIDFQKMLLSQIMLRDPCAPLPGRSIPLEHLLNAR